MSSIMNSAVKIAVGLATGSLFTLKIAPHVFPEQLCKNVAEWKAARNPEEQPTGIPVPLRCQQQLKGVLQKLRLEQEEQKIKLFICDGYSLISAGATWLPNGAVIGLPKYVLFEKVEDIEAAGLTFKQKSVNWKSNLGGRLKNSLLASDINLAFLIGHELSHIKGSDVVYDATIAPAWLYATYKLTASTGKLIPRAPRFLDVMLKAFVCSLSYLGYSLTVRALKHRREFEADEMAAMIDISMAAGGVDCMLKKLTLNRVLRVLYSEDGKRLYSENGEMLKNYSHPKTTERLRRLEAIVAEKLKEQGIPSSAVGGPNS